MEIKIKIEKRHFYILVILILAAIVIGYGGKDPQIMGHSSGEVDATIDIGQGQQTFLLRDILSQGLIPIKIGQTKTSLQQAINNNQLLDKDDLSSVIKTGSYVGNGAPNREITIIGSLGRTPKAVWVARTDGNGMPFYRISNMALHDECADNTERWCVVPDPGNNLKVINGGFIVQETGNAHSTNKNSIAYEYIAFF